MRQAKASINRMLVTTDLTFSHMSLLLGLELEARRNRARRNKKEDRAWFARSSCENVPTQAFSDPTERSLRKGRRTTMARPSRPHGHPVSHRARFLIFIDRSVSSP